MIQCPVPIIGFCAFSGTGKTTLLTQLIPLLKASGISLGVIKHAHHSFEIDHPDKDSYKLRHAGTQQMLIVSERCIAKIKDVNPHKNEIDLQDTLNELDYDTLDLILVEGFKHYNFPKIELHRPEIKTPLIFPNDNSVIAIATDSELTTQPAHLPVLDLNNIQEIAEFIQCYLKASSSCVFEIELYG